ncbi:hypothetical protein B0F90DRAFT_1670781 [Multifurca ochricompacta]|uniref:Uncharacterized protein n=1 Tax=Multifurca ochricompacta TaxID=376703 RepID=A0AAD4LZ22_9AGAM|nr:hypothetical protein B0F90DRAFT_1670781 [Multifurca ochricompacta]
MTLPSATNPTLQHTIPAVKEVLLHRGMKSEPITSISTLAVWNIQVLSSSLQTTVRVFGDLAHLHVGPGNEGLPSPDCLIKICSSLPDLHPSGGPLQLSGTPSLIFAHLTIGVGNGSGSERLIPPQMITQNDLTTGRTPSPSTIPLMTQTIRCGPPRLTGPRLASLPSPNTPPLQQCA